MRNSRTNQLSAVSTWEADYDETNSEVRLVRKPKLKVMVLPFAASEDVQGAFSDAGYYNTEKDDTTNPNAKGVIRFSSYIENPDNLDITKVGTTLKINGEEFLTKEEVPSKTGSFTFSLDIYGILTSAWDKVITAESYAVSGGNVFTSLNTQSFKVSDSLKWLGKDDSYGEEVYTSTDPDSTTVENIKKEAN